jgi:hypothetical protein
MPRQHVTQAQQRHAAWQACTRVRARTDDDARVTGRARQLDAPVLDEEGEREDVLHRLREAGAVEHEAQRVHATRVLLQHAAHRLHVAVSLLLRCNALARVVNLAGGRGHFRGGRSRCIRGRVSVENDEGE